LHNRASFIIRATWTRPEPPVIESFRGVATALIADALGHGFGVVDHDIRPVWNGPGFAGPALTVETAPDDILAVHASLKFSRPGDVMVVATRSSTRAAVLGGITTGLLRNAKIVAAVTDGVVRDVAHIEANGLPVYARGVSPGIPFKNGPGRIGLAVSLGHVAIAPGDIVVGDRDGIVVIPLAHAQHTANALENARNIEADLEAVVGAGTAVPPYAEQALAELDVNYVS
jgi:4-hydroxy-4-methyl-2-oxoglutarate aldolase